MIETSLLPYRSFPTVIANTNETTVYTCQPNMWAQVTEIVAADDAGEARTITLTWTDSSATVTATLAFTAVIAAATTYKLELARLALDPGDTVKATVSAGGVHVTVNVIEYQRQVSRVSA